MTLRQPPAFAGRLLKRLVPAHDHTALLGDLCEDFQRDRSVFWYWAQIVAAIVVGSCKDIRAHWLLALRSILVGLATFIAYFQVVGIWTLNNIHWVRLPGHVGFFVMAEFFFLVGFAASGWAVGRTHRGYGITLVIPFAALMGVLALSDLFRIVMLHSVTVFDLVKPITFPAAILLGGYRAARHVEAA